MVYADEIRNLVEMSKSMDESLNTYESLMLADFEEKHGLRFGIIGELATFKRSQIEKFSDNVVNNIYTSFVLDRESKKDNTASETYEETSKKRRETLLTIYDESEEYIRMLYDREKVHHQVEDAKNDYVKYLESDEYKAKKQENLDKLHQLMEDAKTDEERAHYQDVISTLKSAEKLEFIFCRFNLFGDAEIDNIAENFFDKRRVKYIEDKYITKMTKLGFKNASVAHLTRIEETFLGEGFAPYNNLFLFIAMRYVAYSDLSDKKNAQFISSLILKLNKLVYHKLGDDENEMVEVIRAVDEKFVGMRDRFANSNPYYTKRAMIFEEMRKSILNWYSENNLTLPEGNEAMTADELREKALYDMKRVDVINWLDKYEIKHDKDSDLESLVKIKESILDEKRKELEAESAKEEENEEKSESDEISDTVIYIDEQPADEVESSDEIEEN